MKRNDFLGTEEPDEPANPFFAEPPKPASVEPGAKAPETAQNVILRLPKKK